MLSGFDPVGLSRAQIPFRDDGWRRRMASSQTAGSTGARAAPCAGGLSLMFAVVDGASRSPRRTERQGVVAVARRVFNFGDGQTIPFRAASRRRLVAPASCIPSVFSKSS
jgi:hypothetical protein